jgi:adenylate cyclase
MSVVHSETQEVVALNADVVGYSRLMADDFEFTTEVVESYRRLVEENVVTNRGTLVNFVGDSFMAVFDGAADALHAAIGISTAVAIENADRPRHRQVVFRMGLDQGEALATPDGRYFGDALNVAARIQAIALPGGVSVSGAVYRALDEPALRFRALGAKDLKNIPENVAVYQLVDLPQEQAAGVSKASLALEPPTVAVLPVHTDSVGDSLKAAGPVLVSEIVHRLARIPALHVVDAADETSRQRANVDYMLESGIHQFGDQLRIYAKLVDLATINVVASHRWEGTVATFSSLADEVAEEVAGSLEIELIVGEPARLYAEVNDPEALENIYRGWYHITEATEEGWRRAVELFTRVAEARPGHPHGHALLAFAYWLGAAEGYAADRAATIDKAREHARVGMAAGDPTGLCSMVEAAILMDEGQPDLALEKAESAHITRPTCDVTYALEGSVRRYLGQWDRALELLDRAMKLTPVTKPWYPTVQACTLYMGGRFEDAATVAEAVLEHHPQNLEALLVLTAAQEALGLDRRAKATAAVIRNRFPAVDADAWLSRNPYRDSEMVEQWRRDLAKAGVISRSD